MNPTVKTLARFAFWTFAALTLIAATLFYAHVQPGGSGVLASLRLPDGSEYMVSQRCNWGPDPYTVDFYMRSSDGPWGWCYLDHEADRWRDVTMTHNEQSDTINITERGQLRASLDRKQGTFWFDNGDGNPRGGHAPQQQRPPEFALQ
jgi:hypothetical protein